MAWVVNDSGEAWTVNASPDLTATVKNTFLTLIDSREEAPPRSNSVPASCRLCKDSTCDGKLTNDSLDLDLLSCRLLDVREKDGLDLDSSTWEGSSSMCWESGSTTPLNSWCQPDGVHQQLSSKKVRSPWINKRASTRRAFKVDQGNEGEKSLEDHFIDAITFLKDSLRFPQSEHIANVEVHEDAGTYSVIIQLAAGQGDRSSVTEELLAFAQKRLLEAVSKSKHIWVMGYCNPQPFLMHPQGFEATLAAVKSPADACWNILKRGFCRHGADCSNKHPVFQTPVHVHVLAEGVQFNPSASFAGTFKQEVADVIMEVVATIRQCCYADAVGACKDDDCESWTIEVTLTQDAYTPLHKDDVLTVAKSTLHKATLASDTVYIIGYAAKPFQLKDGGFATLLGDMRDESMQCWDFYRTGVCKYGHACKWSHPECLIPINAVIKVK